MNKWMALAIATLMTAPAFALTGDLPLPGGDIRPIIVPESPAVTEKPRVSFSAECIQAFVRAGYDINYGNRIALCQNLRNEYSLQAVKTIAANGGSFDDSTLANLARIDGPNSLRCVNAFISSGYDINYGNRVSLCASVASANASAAVESIAGNGGSFDDSTLANLVVIRTSLGTACVNAFVANGYDINYGNRSAFCGRMGYSDIGVSALKSVADQGGSLDDSTARGLLSIRGTYGLQCVRILVNAGYDVNYGNRVALCAQFSSSAAIQTLSAVAQNGGSLEDATLAQLARLH